MGPRSATLQVSRPLLFRPFTSVTTAAQDTKTPTFEFAVPRQEDDERFVLLSEMKWPTTRFVYVFVPEARLLDPTTLEGLVLRAAVGVATADNLLLMAVRVEPSGEEALCFGKNYKAALTAGSPVPFQPSKLLEYVGLEPDALREFADDLYAVAAPIQLRLEAIGRMESRRPRVLPTLGTGMGIGVTEPVTATPGNPDWVFPTVDPLLVAENLARKFYEAADNFLAASQQFDRPAARNEEERAGRTEGELRRLKKTIADNLVALRAAAPSLESAFDNNLRVGYPEAFMREYRPALDELVYQRELAAFRLVAWLESDLFALADDWWERQEGKPNADYELYVTSALGGLARLAESDRGIQYLMDLRNRLESSSSAPPSGVLHVIGDFLFRDTKSTSEQQAVAAKTSTTLFGAWSAFVAAAVGVEQRLVSGPNPTTNLVEDVRAFARRLGLVLGELLGVDVSNIPIELSIPGGTKKTVVSVPTPSLVLSPSATAVIRKTKLNTEHVARMCAVLNFGLAYAAWRRELAKAGDPRAKHMAWADLAGASLGLLDKTAALPQLNSFRNQMAGKVNMGGALLGNRVASTLGLLGALASLISASMATAQEFERGDWNKAMAHMTEGFGALLMGAGSTVMLVSGTTGPLALWTVTAGASVSAAGFVWSVFAADTEIDQMLKFCAFGDQSGGDARPAPGWSLCKQSFQEWNPGTAAGLLLQLRAFQQIFYSFEAAGAHPTGPSLASDSILRITPATLRRACWFDIQYTAVYGGVGGKSVTREGKALLIIPATAGDEPAFADQNGNYETVDATRVHREGGRHAIDVRFRLMAAWRESSSGRPFELDSLTCHLQLRLPGLGIVDGSGDEELIVPTTAKGARMLTVKLVKQRQRVEDTVFSTKAE